MIQVMAKFILCPFGSGGDVNPFVWIGRLLNDLGHEVMIVTVPLFEQVILSAGLNFRAVGRTEDYEKIVHDPGLWKPLKATSVVFKAAADAIDPFFEVIRDEVEKGRARGSKIVLAAPFHLPAARLAREVLNVPLVTVHLQPIAMLSRYDETVVLADAPWLARLPLWMKQVLYSMPNPADWFLTPAIRRQCSKYGVIPPKRFLTDWLHSPDAVLCLWPEWFATRQPDWPENACAAGFPLEDLRDQIPLSESLHSFLHEGNKPVLLTAGTGNAQAAEFFAKGIEACGKIGCRALLGTRYRDQLPAVLPDYVRHFDYLPFSKVLPNVAVAVHHGGIGTMSQCMAAGVPQLVVPFAHDQPDNATRMKRLGVGTYITPKKLNADSMAVALSSLLTDTAIKRRCDEVAALCRQDQAGAKVVELFESVTS